VPQRRRSSLVLTVALVLAGPAIGACSTHSLSSSRAGGTSSTTSLLVGTPGPDGAGDPLLPGTGNGGYDVTHYDLAFDATNPSGSLVATTTVDAVATQDLSRYDLDLTGFTVDAVHADGAPANFSRVGRELVVTPRQPIAKGHRFRTVVAYRGVPSPVVDPTGLGPIGWLAGRGGSSIASEPAGAEGIFPCDDHPSDKATYTIRVTAPTHDQVIASGVETTTTTSGTATTHVFEMTAPMATYLLQLAIGNFRVATATTPDGVTLRSAAPVGSTVDLAAINARTGQQLAYFSSLFGPYPFTTAGALIADIPPSFALETQTIPIYPTSWFTGPLEDTSVVTAHEISHQWFGDDVSVEQWSDIWLNEGFATYAEWLWADHIGAVPLATSVDVAMARLPELRKRDGAVVAPSTRTMFDGNEYDGAAVTLAALRRTIGDGEFFELLRQWVRRHAGSNATTDDFIALANDISGRDFTSFFDTWLRSTSVPTMPR
jgi:aminopeptidase N